MGRPKFSENQVAFALRKPEAGTPVADVCRQIGAGEASFYIWKKKYANLGVSELRELRQLGGVKRARFIFRLENNGQINLAHYLSSSATSTPTSASPDTSTCLRRDNRVHDNKGRAGTDESR